MATFNTRTPHSFSCCYVIPHESSINYCLKVTCGAEQKAFTTLEMKGCVGRWFLEVIGNYVSIHSLAEDKDQ